MPELHERVGRLENQVSTLITDHAALKELVDGQEDWSHRKKLHKLENDNRAAMWAARALDAYREHRDNTWNRVREWSSFAIAAGALLIAWHPWR